MGTGWFTLYPQLTFISFLLHVGNRRKYIDRWDGLWNLYFLQMRQSLWSKNGIISKIVFWLGSSSLCIFVFLFPRLGSGHVGRDMAVPNLSWSAPQVTSLVSELVPAGSNRVQLVLGIFTDSAGLELRLFSRLWGKHNVFHQGAM